MIQYSKAKINIGLWVTKKRADGYHDLESIFYPVDIHDIIEIIPSPDGCFLFSTSGLQIPGAAEENLVVNAFRMMQSSFHLPQIHMHLHKRIPMGSGLGGGSGDAATVISMIDQLFELGLTLERKRELASSLGSDCPFFINPRPSLVTGRGEMMEAIGLDLSGYLLILVYPGIALGTKEAYAGVIPKRRTVSLNALVGRPISEWKDMISNDFEESAFQRFPVIQDIKQQLYDTGAVYASLTGSGSAVYGLFPGDVLDKTLLTSRFQSAGYLVFELRM